MVIVLQIILLIVGFFCLVKGADTFVSGSSALARHFKIPSLIIGLTIVALGTSAPELAVSTVAAIQGSNEIALSNVVGSNMFNFLAVLGVCAIIHPVPVDKLVLKRDFPFSIITSALLLFMTCGAALFKGNVFGSNVSQEIGIVSRLTGLILVILFCIYIGSLIYFSMKHTSEDGADTNEPIWKCFIFIIIGLALIIGGGQAVVYGAKGIARAAGMSETLIGLTIVAVGTSLPELVTSIAAARKGETEMAIGNVVGSNIINLLFILGISALINPISINLASLYDMLILLAISIVAYIFCLTSKKISRPEGIVMLSLYIGDIIFAIVR